MAAQVGRALRDLRRLADGARADLREGLGPEVSDFDIADLNPKHFVRKHLFDDRDDLSDPSLIHQTDADRDGAFAGRQLTPAEQPTSDAKAASPPPLADSPQSPAT